MADAKITLTTEIKDEGLDKMNDALAAGQQKAKALKQSLQELEKETKKGTVATEEQTKKLQDLQKASNEQEQANKRLEAAIKEYVKDMTAAAKVTVDADKGARDLSSRFNSTKGFTTALSVALGNLATEAISKVTDAFVELCKEMAEAGLKAQQTIAQFSAMKNVTGDATEAWRQLNDTYRNTNFEEGAVVQMGVQLMNLGYSAKNASDLIALCADAAAGLGTGQQGAQQLVDAISRIQAVGELTSRQMTQLKMSGIDMDAAFKSLGMNGEQAMKAVEDGTLDTQQAIQALTNYLHTFDGSMAQSKNNIVDQWGDVAGNIQTVCAEIGVSIIDAFSKSEIIQDLISFTQDLVDMIRGEGCGAFSDLKVIAEMVLEGIDNFLKVIITSIKFIILVLDEAYSAFRSFGQQVYAALQPAIDALSSVMDLVRSIMSSIGKGFAGEVDRSWKSTFGSNLEPEERAERARAARKNNFRQRVASGGSRSGGRSGGGGGGSAKAQLTEEEKAVDALVKKYADAEKQKWALAKSTVELAKVNTGMMVGEAKAVQDKQNKIDELTLAHKQLMDGYAKELVLAEQIKDTDQRNKTIDSIMEQIRAEKALYDAKVNAAEWEKNYADLQKESKSLIDKFFGEPDSWKARVEKIKEETTKALQEIDAVMAAPDEETQLSGMAQILQKTPEALEEELAKKGESIAVFAQNYRDELAKTKAALAENITATGQWHDWLKSYATDIGKSMGNALTDWITGAKTASEALKEFVQGLIKNALQLLAQWLSIYAIFLLTGDPHLAAQAATKAVFGVDIGKGAKSAGSGISIGASAEKGTFGFASGGYIVGAGTGISDSIPAMLSNGEYVIRSAAVDRIGVGTLDAINAGAVPHFANGGQVGDTIAASAGGNVVTLHLSMLDTFGFEDFMSRGGLDVVKQALFSNNREFGSEVGVW